MQEKIAWKHFILYIMIGNDWAVQFSSNKLTSKRSFLVLGEVKANLI